MFGGQQLTATDLAVAVGQAQLGDPVRVTSLPVSLREAGLTYISRCLADSIDRMKLTADPVPVIVVGGGSILCPSSSPVWPKSSDLHIMMSPMLLVLP